MRIPRQTKIHFFSYITVLLVTFFSLYSAVSACTIFNLSDCVGDGVIYCQPGDTSCSLSGGTSIVSTGINDIEKNDKFSVYIQKVIIYLLAFL